MGAYNLGVVRPGALFAVVILQLGACAAPNSEIHLAPLFARHTVPEFQRAEAVAGLLQYRRDRMTVEWTLAPLLWWERQLFDGHVHADFLLGLGRYEYEPDRERTYARVFPLWWYWSEIRPDGVRDTDWSLLMWLVGGGSSSDDQEDYFWFFPFGGKGKDILTYDEFTFVLWPLYIHNEKDARESTHVLWPFIGWQGGTEKGWRLWPFYGTAEWPDHYRKRFILWPFWSEGVADLDKKHPTRSWFLFPFYGRTTQDDWTAQTVLWPFFGWASRPSTGYRNFTFWPLVKFHHGPEDDPVKITRVLPFWFSYEDEQVSTQASPWPLFWHREERYSDVDVESWHLVPFWAWSRSDYDDGRTAHSQRLWPLYSWRRTPAGDTLFRAFDLGLPGLFNGDTLSHLFGTLYEFWVARARLAGPPLEETRGFLDLYHSAEAGGHRRWSVSGLGGKWTEPDGTSHWSLLFGLLRWRTGDGGGLEVPAFPGPGWPDLSRLPAELPETTDQP